MGKNSDQRYRETMNFQSIKRHNSVQNYKAQDLSQVNLKLHAKKEISQWPINGALGEQSWTDS